MKRLAIFSVFVIMAMVIVWYCVFTGGAERQEGGEPDVAEAPSWAWKNPYTYKQAVIPSGWKKVEGEQIRDSVLALQHESGKCLIYITYVESVNNLSLPEYIDAVKPMNQKEFGINEFARVIGKSTGEFYQAEGARYLGGILVNVDIRIWSDGSNGFWETVVTTDMEYRSIEYDARELVNVLAETTI